MKLNLTKVGTKVTGSKVTLFAAVLLAVCIFTGSANAQSTFKGKFTLQHSARWGKTVLGAGDYVIDLNHNNDAGPLIAVIRYAKSGRVAARETCSAADGATKGDSALFIGHRGNQQVIHSFRVAQLGETFVYDRTLASRQVSEEAMDKEKIPVLEAKKQ
jgi:hypothetical protein